MSTPPPPGFVLDGSGPPGGLPEGFVLDEQKPGKVASALTNLPIVGPAIRGALALDPSLAQTPGKMLANAPQSAGNFAQAIVQPILHPVDTAKGIGSILAGLETPQTMEKDATGTYRPQPVQETPEAKAARIAPAQATGQFFKDRYGGYSNIKNTLETDPIGASADLATLLMGGSTLPVRGAATLGKVGAMLDPLTQAGNVVKGIGKLGEIPISQGLGFTTGAGAQSVRTAASSGREGGEVGQVFRENMRGEAPPADVVRRAEGALQQAEQERSAAYKAGYHDLKKDARTIDFDAIDSAVNNANEVGVFRGHSGTAPAVGVEPAAMKITQEMQDHINAWKMLPADEYHTPVGIDALKKRLGNIKDTTERGTPERVAADRIYNSVRGVIAEKAPGYSKMMDDYGRASDTLKEVRGTFSLNEKALDDTAIRKLVSSTRNNVQTNYGGRQRLVDILAEKDPTLPAAIAGQAMASPLPRGLVARLGAPAAVGSIGTAALSNPISALGIPVALAASSPRVVGELAHAGGRAVGATDRLAEMLGVNAQNVRGVGEAAFQGGRLNDQEKRRLLAQALMRANEQRVQ